MTQRPLLRPAIAALLSCGLAPLAVQPALADGTFFQSDVTEDAADVVGAVVRGRLGFGANYSRYDGGSAAGASMTYAFPVEGLGTFRVGPTLGASFGDSGDDKLRAGAKVVFERYQPTDFGSLFWLGEYNTIDNNWFASVQAGFAHGWGIEASAGGSDKYDARTLAVSKKLGEGPVSLRGGYKFVDDAFFLGVAVNTF